MWPIIILDFSVFGTFICKSDIFFNVLKVLYFEPEKKVIPAESYPLYSRSFSETKNFEEVIGLSENVVYIPHIIF